MSPPSGLFKFHRPKPNIRGAPMPPLSEESRRCLKTLSQYRSKEAHHVHVPRSCRAAVLVALFVGRQGDLYVLLSRRASTLRTYAGDTSLPGGKVDPEDKTIEDTARREAFEEIGLPQDRFRVPLLCVLDPFLAGNSMVVTPVVVLILDNTLQPILNAAEVTAIFSHPLRSFLTTTSPFPMDPLPAPELGAEHPEHREYHSYVDFGWPFGPFGEPRTLPIQGHIRMHRFLTGREAGGVKPVFGLTASILIDVASIGYALQPDFTVLAPNQPSMSERIEWAALHSPRIQAAKERELEDVRSRLRSLTGDEASRTPRSGKTYGLATTRLSTSASTNQPRPSGEASRESVDEVHPDDQTRRTKDSDMTGSRDRSRL